MSDQNTEPINITIEVMLYGERVRAGVRVTYLENNDPESIVEVWGNASENDACKLQVFSGDITVYAQSQGYSVEEKLYVRDGDDLVIHLESWYPCTY